MTDFDNELRHDGAREEADGPEWSALGDAPSWVYLHPAEAETRGEPEAVDVWADQGLVDWTRQLNSDDLLASDVKRRLGLRW